jgi:hypothetical protein
MLLLSTLVAAATVSYVVFPAEVAAYLVNHFNLDELEHALQEHQGWKLSACTCANRLCPGLKIHNPDLEKKVREDQAARDAIRW